MRTRSMRAAAVAGTVFALAMFLPGVARADYVSDAEQAIDASGVLPFSVSDWDSILRSCSSSDDIIACAKAAAIMEGLDPDNADQAAEIYGDIIHKDYTGLISDAGVAVACAASEAFFGFNACNVVIAVGQKLGNAAEPVANAVVCSGITGIRCNDGSIGWGQLTETVQEPNCPVGVWQKGQSDGGTHFYPMCYCPAPTNLYSSAGELSQTCAPGTSTPGIPQDCTPTLPYPGDFICRQCPQGQAAQGGACAVCPKTGGMDEVQSADKRSWTRTYWTQSGEAATDGSHCIQSGTGKVDVWNCPAGQIAPAYGTCAPVCAIGSIYNTTSNSCQVCNSGTYATYSNGLSNSLGACMACPHGMVSAAKGAACTCPSGWAQDDSNSACKICPANTYQNFAVCSVCPDNESSEPGQTYCRPLNCPPDTHALGHRCVEKMNLPSGTDTGGGGPAVVPAICGPGTHREGGQCVPFSPIPSSNDHPCPSGEEWTGDSCAAKIASPCPPLSKWTGAFCIGPRGKHFCPGGLALKDDACVSPCPPRAHWTGSVCIGPLGRSFCPEGQRMERGACVP
jgi:hypothetical protein